MLSILNHQADTLRCSATRQEGLEGRSKYEMADIFRHYGEEYRITHLLPPSHLKVMHDIEVCRTAYLGGHIEKCDSCGFERYSYNSCRNRHCPKCQSLTKARWLEARKAEVLPVAYFHNVFTLPHEINPIALCNKKIIFAILFKAVSETLLEFGRNPKNGLGGKIGFIAILHTWDQTLMDHFHLHCVVPAGALSFDGSQWTDAKKDFLFPVKALSKVFRGKFIHYLEKAFENATAPCLSLALWPIRLTMGGIFLFHGAGKFMMPAMAAMMGLSVTVWYVVGAAEIAGGAGFIVGGILAGSTGTLITRLSGLAIIPVMLGAIFMVHWGQWNFMPSETHPAGGMEFQTLVLAVAIAALITGFSQSKAQAE